LASALPPSITNSTPSETSRPRSRSPLISPRATVAFSVEPSTTPSGTFVPSAVTPSAPTMVWPAKSNPSTNTISQRSPSSGRERNSASRSAVAVMNRRLTELCDVPDAPCSTCAPTGSSAWR